MAITRDEIELLKRRAGNMRRDASIDIDVRHALIDLEIAAARVEVALLKSEIATNTDRMAVIENTIKALRG